MKTVGRDLGYVCADGVPRKAWLVSDRDGEWNEVVWAWTRGRAKLLAMREFDVEEFVDARAKRFPQADALWPRVPAVKWLEWGYHTPCLGCDADIHPSDTFALGHNGDVYCSNECLRGWWVVVTVDPSYSTLRHGVAYTARYPHEDWARATARAYNATRNCLGMYSYAVFTARKVTP